MVNEEKLIKVMDYIRKFSEENGYISLASGGVLKRRLSPENLEKILCDQLLPKNDADQKTTILDWMKGLKKK